MLCGTHLFAGEVLQKSILAFPCCMGSICFCGFHAARRCFLIFSTPPQRESPKWKTNRTSKLWFGGVDAEGATSKKWAANLRPAPVVTIGTRFSNSETNLQIDSKMFVIPPGISIIMTSALTRPHCKFDAISKQRSKHVNNLNNFSNFNCFRFPSNLVPSQDSQSSVWSLADQIPGCGVLK